MLVSLARQFEGVAQHAIDPTPRKNRLLHRHFLIRSLVKAAADVRVFSFVVFADDTKVNLTGLPVLEWRLDSFKEPYWAEVHVLAEAAAQGNEQAPQGNVVGNIRMSNGSEENSVKRLELRDAIRGHHSPGLDIGFAAPVQAFPGNTESKALCCRFQDSHAFRHNFFADSVSGDNRDMESSHRAFYPFSDDSKGDKAPISGADSRAFTKSMMFSVFDFGHFACSAQPRNFSAASSKVMGSAGLPFAKSA